MPLTWPAIGSESFLAMEGRVVPIAETLEEITRAHADGHAFRTMGKRADVVGLFTEVDVADAAAAATKIAAYQAMQATLQTVKHPDQQQVTNVAIRRVSDFSVKAGITGTGGVNGGSWKLAARWEVQATE